MDGDDLAKVLGLGAMYRVVGKQWTLKCMYSEISSRWSDLTTGVIWRCLEVLLGQVRVHPLYRAVPEIPNKQESCLMRTSLSVASKADADKRLLDDLSPRQILQYSEVRKVSVE